MIYPWGISYVGRIRDAIQKGVFLRVTQIYPTGMIIPQAKRSKWLKLLYLAATNRKISSRISIITCERL